MKAYRSLQEVKADISTGTVTCRQLTEYYLENIRKKKNLNAFLEVYEAEALLRADEVTVAFDAIVGEALGLATLALYGIHTSISPLPRLFQL